MAEYERAQKSLRDLPYFVTSKIMRSMDTDKGWEDLAAAAGFTLEEMMLLKGKQSPTRKLIMELGYQGYKVHDLHEKLQEARRIFEMNILKEYIKNGGHEPKYNSYSYSSNSQAGSSSLQSLISQLEITVPPSSSSSNSSHGNSSEVNFNHPLFMSPSKAQVAGAKVYDDKVIPGASQASSFSSSVSKPYQESMALADILRKHGQSTAALPSRHQQPLGSGGTDFTLASTPSLMCSSSASSSYSGAQRLIDQLASETRSQKTPAPPTPCESQSEEDVAISMKAAFTYREISTATQNFSAGILGQGAFGTVYLGCVRGQQCAVKRLNEESNTQSDPSNKIKKELAALLKYQHKNIVTLYGYALDGPHICLVYEYLKNGSLEDRLHLKDSTAPLPWERRLNILVGACQALHFLHTIGEQPLIHGDIKSANILLDGYLEAKICDFGQARYASSGDTSKSSLTHITLAESSTKRFGTRAYQAQEILSNSSISVKSDVYSMGVVMLEVSSGKLAYDQNRNENKFLVALFKNQIKERNENEWAQEFGDPNASKVPKIFIDLLKLADRCVKDAKKSRPDSAKLLAEIERLYREECSPSCSMSPTESEDYCDSVSSSVRANTDLSSSTNYQRNLSEMSDDMSFSRPSVTSQSRSTPPSLSVQLQNEKMREFNSCSNWCDRISQPSSSTLLTPEMQHRINSSSSESLESQLQSEPLALQKLYDKHPGKRIDQISTPTFGTAPNGKNDTAAITSDDYSLQSDPIKMAMLLQCDRQNFPPSDGNDSSSMCPVSEAKLRYLTKMDDTAYMKQHPVSMSYQTPTNPSVNHMRTHPEPTPPHQLGPVMNFSCQSATPPWLNNGNALSSSHMQNVEGAKEVCFHGQNNNIDNTHPASDPRTQSVEDKDSADFQNRMIRKRDNLLNSYMKAVSND